MVLSSVRFLTEHDGHKEFTFDGAPVTCICQIKHRDTEFLGFVTNGLILDLFMPKTELKNYHNRYWTNVQRTQMKPQETLIYRLKETKDTDSILPPTLLGTQTRSDDSLIGLTLWTSHHKLHQNERR